MTTSVQ